MAKTGAVINKASGTLSPKKAQDLIDEIKQHLEPVVSPGCLAIVSGEKVRQEIKRLIDENVDVLIVGGGDGTISTGAELIGEKDIILAVIALGTRNHFARDLFIPLEPEKAIRLLDKMEVQQIDIGEVNGHIFINNATLGLYPEIVREREEKTKKHGWRKWRAQIAATLKVIRRLPRMGVTVESENFRVKRFTPLLFIGNNEYKGLFNSESSRPSITSGRLWLCMARASGMKSLLRMAWQLATKGIQGAENLETHLLKEVTVKPRRRRVTVAIDGENHKLKTPLRFRILSKKLRVVVP